MLSSIFGTQIKTNKEDSMKQKKFLTPILISFTMFAGLLTNGCGSDSAPVVPEDNYSNQKYQGDIILSPSKEIYPRFSENNISGYLESEYNGETTFLSAEFFDNDRSVDAGGVIVNNHQLQLYGGSKNKYYFAMKDNPGFEEINFDGSAHEWTVVGNTNVQKFNSAVNSPKVIPQLTLPASDEDINKKDGLKIEWSNTSGNQTYIELYQTDDDGFLTAGYLKFVSGNSFTVPSQSLAHFTSGSLIVKIVVFTHNTYTASNGKKYKILSSTYSYRFVNLI